MPDEPVRAADGEADPHSYTDDPTIAAEAVLWRRIRPNQVVFDEARSDWRPSSEAFKDRPTDDTVSVFIADELKHPQVLLAGHRGWSVVAITAGLARENGRGVMRDPLPDGPPGHAMLFTPPHVTRSQVKRLAERIARGSTWVIRPPESV